MSGFPFARRFGAGILVLACAVGAAACGGDDGADAKAEPVKLTPPASIKDAGEIVFCSDMEYPPVEFMEDGKPKGSDIDMGRELAKRMGVEAKFVDTNFDGILAALKDKQCDAVVSAMTITEERKKEVRFVAYADWGQSLMVQTANPGDVEGIDDLEGAKVAVHAGTINEEYLKERAAERQDIEVRVFDNDTDATAALKDGTVDAYFGDSPVVAYYIGKEALTYSFAGNPVNAEPIGIALRPDDTELERELERGIDSMYADGTMRSILKRWKLEDFALKQ